MTCGKASIPGLLLGLILLGLSACSDQNSAMNRSEPPLPQVTDAQLDALSGKTFYFAHQSVGYNIVDGIARVLARLGRPGLFSIRELQPGQPVPEVGVLHSKVGNNGDPESKLSEFQNYLDERLGDARPDMAMLKFCYLDIDKGTDVSALADEYDQSLKEVGRKHPETLMIYSTIPLRVFNDSWKARIKRWLDMDVWGDEANIKRNEYNALIRKKYAQTGRLADVAAWESTYPDGKPHRIKLFGKEYAELIPEYSNDGKHLNDYGQQVVAGRLLELLATMGR
ncbi:SGNH/GDSL hydrolase family protein [Thiolapillus brandeum]|uniref:SGNH/GDSL hydrolase family protein n=1 Tax=Thiolapillus brandeum TaxID=1076588 RepID=A0A7U6GKR6_9GAMM|nr:hypothetical protein [Thiolapillus brandeum]BAO45450.1 conserved hypothetical protein [Thiolapillus brandeum]